MLDAVIARGTQGPKLTAAATATTIATLRQPRLPDRPKVFQPQIFVLPPNMFVSSNGLQTLVTMTTNSNCNSTIQKGQIQVLNKPG